MPDDMSYYDRRLAKKLENPEFRAGFELAKREIERIDKAVPSAALVCEAAGRRVRITTLRDGPLEGVMRLNGSDPDVLLLHEVSGWTNIIRRSDIFEFAVLDD
jgi:hypothetical protein